MMRFPQIFGRKAKAFRDDQGGNSAVELTLMVPILTVITLGSVTFYEAFKAKTQAARAATVLTDVISRETNPITPTYMTGLSGLMDTLIETDANPEYRVTAFTWSDTADEYRVRWSKHDSEKGARTTASLNAVAGKLPELKHGQRAILVETWVDYEPIHHSAFEDTKTFENFLVAAPRFVPQLCWLPTEDDPTLTPAC